MTQHTNLKTTKRWWQYFDIRDVAIACGVLIVCASLLSNFFIKFYRTQPEIVVYLDKDSKQPAILPLPETTVVAGDRAVLWWTVFNKCLEKNGNLWESQLRADAAVSAVYGPRH